MKPTLAVLITYHNEKELLRECLDSLLKGTERPDEVWVYDDASQDPAESFIPKDFPIRIVRSEIKKEACYGRNLLGRMTHCDYVHFHDADDFFYPQWCRLVRRKTEETAAEMILTEVTLWRDQKIVCEKVLGLESLVRGGDLRRFSLEAAILPIASTLRRKTVLAAGGYNTENLRHSQDFYLHARLAFRGASHSFIEEPLVFKRARARSMSHDRIRVWAEALKAMKLLKPEIPAEYWPDLTEAAAHAGSVLYQLGGWKEGSRAFRLARQWGAPRFIRRSRPYRLAANLVGPEAAEFAGTFYRKLPVKFRAALAGRNG